MLQPAQHAAESENNLRDQQRPKFIARENGNARAEKLRDQHDHRQDDGEHERHYAWSLQSHVTTPSLIAGLHAERLPKSVVKVS